MIDKKNAELVHSIKQRVRKNKKNPKIGWTRSGSLPFFPIDDSKKILQTKIKDLVELIFNTYSGKPKDILTIAQSLTYGCAEILIDERCFANIQEFESIEEDVYNLALNAAGDVANNDNAGIHLHRFTDTILDFDKREDLYSKLKLILAVDDISSEMVCRIRETVHEYQININTYLGKPTESQVEASLRWLVYGYQEGEKELRKRFKTLDAETKNRLASVDFPHNLDIMNSDDAEPERLLSLIDKAIDALQKNRNKRKLPTGPRKWLILDLCDIYFRITHQKPSVTYYMPKSAPNNGNECFYSGRFWDFVCLILKTVDPKSTKYIQSDSLGVRIAEICSFYNKGSRE